MININPLDATILKIFFDKLQEKHLKFTAYSITGILHPEIKDCMMLKTKSVNIKQKLNKLKSYGFLSSVIEEGAEKFSLDSKRVVFEDTVSINGNKIKNKIYNAIFLKENGEYQLIQWDMVSTPA